MLTLSWNYRELKIQQEYHKGQETSGIHLFDERERLGKLFDRIFLLSKMIIIMHASLFTCTKIIIHLDITRSCRLHIGNACVYWIYCEKYSSFAATAFRLLLSEVRVHIFCLSDPSNHGWQNRLLCMYIHMHNYNRT